MHLVNRGALALKKTIRSLYMQWGGDHTFLAGFLEVKLPAMFLKRLNRFAGQLGFKC
jgi:hypothetical protein